MNTKKQVMFQRLKQIAVVTTAVGAAAASNAAVDVTPITGELSGAQVAGATVAAAAILIPLGIKVFKYIRSAF
ncbi:major capsid protein [Acinetobacter lactucae]|uniref:major capsid protein n=1 Tax=Acinetobacter lactucae TaxID=1785128 RepID=UPI0015806A51|nr:major capsid protein [Acinetobacter lactucae]NUF38925.1 alpha/beta hydrolase [Acinetobacter lactucae]